MHPSKTHHRIFGILITLKLLKNMENQDIQLFKTHAHFMKM